MFSNAFPTISAITNEFPPHLRKIVSTIIEDPSITREFKFSRMRCLEEIENFAKMSREIKQLYSGLAHHPEGWGKKQTWSEKRTENRKQNLSIVRWGEKFYRYIYNKNMVEAMRYHKKLETYERETMDNYMFDADSSDIALLNAEGDGGLRNAKYAEGDSAYLQLCNNFKICFKQRTEEIDVLTRQKALDTKRRKKNRRKKK